MESVDGSEVNAAVAVCAEHKGVDYFTLVNGIVCQDSTLFQWQDAKNILAEKSKKESTG